jgi:hypothetical protein
MPNALLGEVGLVVMIQNIPRNAFFCHHKLSLTSLEHGEATYLLAYATRGSSTFFLLYLLKYQITPRITLLSQKNTMIV